jgi:hypothetical protein
MSSAAGKFPPVTSNVQANSFKDQQVPPALQSHRMAAVMKQLQPSSTNSAPSRKTRPHQVAPIQAATKSPASWPGPVLALLSLSLALHCLSFAGRESRKAHHQPKGRKNKKPT